MERSEYNAKVQDMQAFCISAGLEQTVLAPPNLENTEFRVFYGRWRVVGYEKNPMTPKVERFYDEYEDAKIRAEVARDIVR